MLSTGLLVLAAFVAGVVNAIAGGGAFITFPAMVFAGIPPVLANASSTVALFPGQATSALAYRRDILGITEPADGVALVRWRSRTGARAELHASLWRLSGQHGDGQWQIVFNQATAI